MKDKNELFALELLSDLDDDMIMAATLPEAQGAAGKRPRRGRSAGVLARFMDSGWAAAIISVTVAMAVLLGIIAAGRMGTGFGSQMGAQDSTQGSDGADTQGHVLTPPFDEIDVGPLSAGSVTVTSDGQTIKLASGMLSSIAHSIVNGEPVVDQEEGAGLRSRLSEIAPKLPVLTTAGTAFTLTLPADHELNHVRVYDEQLREMEPVAQIDAALPDLRDLPDGTYYVLLEVTYRAVNSPEEWKEVVNEYGFRLDKDQEMDEAAPVRVQATRTIHYLTGYLLQRSYRDEVTGQEVVADGEGVEARLKELVKGMQTVTIEQGESLSLYVSPRYELISVKVYRDLTLWIEANDDEPISLLPTWDADDYYVIVKAVRNEEGSAVVMEFPLHVVLTERRVSADTEGPITEGGSGESQEPPIPTTEPRIKLKGSKSTVTFEDDSSGYILWFTVWDNGGMISVDALGAEGQLADLLDSGALNGYNLVHTVNKPLELTLNAAEDSLTGVRVYDKELNRLGRGSNLSVIDELSEGTYIVILSVTTLGNYIPEADMNETCCTQYAFILELHAS